MTNYIPIILICHLGASDCNEQSAINKVVLETQNTPMSCVLEGNAKSASLAFVPKEGEPFYVKIKCKVEK